MLALDRDDLALDIDPGALAQNLLHRALADQRVQPGFIFHHHGHSATYEVERDLIDLLVLLLCFEALFQLLVVKDRLVEQILQTRVVVAVQVAVVKHLLAGVAVHIQVLFKHDLALGERAGLISAQHVHRAKVLDGVEAFDDDLLARHGQGALRQVDGHDHGQHLGGQPDRHGHRKQERVQPIMPKESVDEKHRRNHDGNEPNHQPGEFVDTKVKAGQLALTDDPGRQRSKVGAISGVNDYGGCGPALHVGAQETEVREFQRVLHVCCRRGGLPFHW